jgi:hypothetical protein
VTMQRRASQLTFCSSVCRGMISSAPTARAATLQDGERLSGVASDNNGLRHKVLSPPLSFGSSLA